MIPVPRPRLRDRWTFLSSGFRPFFLLGSIYAGLAILVWLPVFMGELTLTTTFAPRDWHVHEMLYGYLPAVITGFLFTAIPNWTGRLPIQGKPLLGLVVLWLAGRVCVTFSVETGWLPAMLVDTCFLLLVAAAAAREIIAGRKWSNLNVVVLVLLLLAGNVAFHLEAHFNGAADISIRIGIAIVVMLISLIGGRIIPSFTRNWLARENPGRLPAPFARFDMLVVAIGALALVFWVVWPGGAGTGICSCAGRLSASRSSRPLGWRSNLAGASGAHSARRLRLRPDWISAKCGVCFWPSPASAGIHAWMAGAAGVMTLAVMTRATLGHTGQKLTASASTQAIYAAAIIAALARICAVIEPVHSVPLLHLAAFAWAAAFVGFAISFGPVLISYDKQRQVDAHDKVSMSHAGHHGAVVDFGIWRTLDDQKAGKPSLHAGQRVIHDRVISRHMKLELGDHSATGRHRDGLNTLQRRVRQAAQSVDLVEDLADHVEGRREVRSAHAEEKPHRFSDLGMQGMQFRNRAHRAVEDEILGSLVQQLLDAELLASVLAERRFGIDLALHDIKFVVDRRQARFGLDQDHAIHAVGNVLGDHRRRAVVNVKAGNEGLERHRFFGARIDLQCRSTSAGAGCRMKIHRVDHVAVGRVLQMNVDGVADANANERSRHFAIEGPVAECRCFCEPAFLLDREQIEPDGLGSRLPIGGGRSVGSREMSASTSVCGAAIGVTRNWPCMPANW